MNKHFAIFCVVIAALIYFGPTVSPDPVPVPEPPIPDVDPPIPGDSLSMLIVEEVNDRGDLSADQVGIFTSVPLREWLDSHDVEWRIWDQNVETKFEAEKWRQALAKPRDALPWIYVSNGKSGYSGPLPETVEATIELLEKYE